MPDPWSDIPCPDAPDYDSVKRADPHHPFPYYRGRDFSGRYIFSLGGPARRDRLGKPLSLAAIEVSITETDPGTCRLLLTLTDAAESEVFEALTTDLMAATASMQRSDTEAALVAVISRLNRWHELLKRRRDTILTRQEIIGLVGELEFLRQPVLEKLPPSDAVNAWRGLQATSRTLPWDVRSSRSRLQTVSADRKIRISSADQLDTTSGPIMLACQLLALSEVADPRSRTLNALVIELEERLKERHPGALNVFRAALIKTGYARRPEYDEEAWILTERTFFEIADDFPRIVAHDLDAGIEDVQYSIRYAALARFEIDPTKTMERLFGVRD